MTHSFFCYHFIPEIIFAPKYSVLILLWLLLISYGCGKLLVFLVKLLDKGIEKCQNKQVIKNE